MKTVLNGLWAGFFRPILQRPTKIQFAALCYRIEGSGKKILLITSRDTGRWVLPKGWPIAGTNAKGTALQEAWEEAGVREGNAASRSVGAYTYEKGFNTGWSAPVRTVVYPVVVKKLSKAFPEAGERDRKWFSPSEAANLVQEPELKQLLADFEEESVHAKPTG